MLAEVHIVKAMFFSVVMYGSESWAKRRLNAKELMLSNVILEMNLESPLDNKEIKPVNPKGNQP